LPQTKSSMPSRRAVPGMRFAQIGNMPEQSSEAQGQVRENAVKAEPKSRQGA
jgi:hypothetical protein